MKDDVWTVVLERPLSTHFFHTCNPRPQVVEYVILTFGNILHNLLGLGGKGPLPLPYLVLTVCDTPLSGSQELVSGLPVTEAGNKLTPCLRQRLNLSG